MLRAHGGVWHQKHREKGERPHTSIDPEAHWTKSGWHGWVYGWKLHLVSVVAGVWFPIAALLTAANVADSESAPALLSEMPAEVRFVLGDRHYNTPDLREACEQADRLLEHRSSNEESQPNQRKRQEKEEGAISWRVSDCGL